MRVSRASAEKQCVYCGYTIRKGDPQVLVTAASVTTLVAAHPECRVKRINDFQERPHKAVGNRE